MKKLKELVELARGNVSAVGIAGGFMLLAWLLISQMQPVNTWPVHLLLVLALVTLAAWVTLDFARLRGFFASSRTRKGLQLSATLFLVTGILVLLYYVAVRRTVLRVDLTENQRFSLAPQTVQVVEGLPEPVRFLVFKVENHPLTMHAVAIEMMLNEYRMRNRKIEVEAVDMVAEPEITQQYNVRIPGSVLLLSGPKSRVLTPEDYIKMEMAGQRPRQVANYEEAITAALIALTRREQFTVYFTIGHDERDTGRAENDGASLLKEALVQDGFLVKATNLLLSGTVPADCDLLVMAGPRSAMSEAVVSNVDAYLMQGKPAVLLAEREAPAPYRALLERWGVRVTGEVVIDPERLYMNSLINIPNYSYHEITKDLAEGQRFTGLVFAAALEKSAAALDAKAVEAGLFDLKPLLTSGEKAWGERGSLAEGQQLRRDAGEREGKFDMAYAVTRKAAVVSTDTNGQTLVTHPGPQQDLRLVVIGDADLVGNGFFSTFPGNRDLMLNSINWALGQEKNITIRPKGAVDYRLTLTEGQSNILKIVSIVLMPLAVVIPGLFVYLRRRRNG